MLFLMKKEEFLARKYGNWPVFQKAHSGSSLGDWLKNIQGQAFWDIKTAFQEKDSEDLKWIGGSKEDFWEMDWLTRLHECDYWERRNQRQLCEGAGENRRTKRRFLEVSIEMPA